MQSGERPSYRTPSSSLERDVLPWQRDDRTSGGGLTRPEWGLLISDRWDCQWWLVVAVVSIVSQIGSSFVEAYIHVLLRIAYLLSSLHLHSWIEQTKIVSEVIDLMQTNFTDVNCI